MAKPPPLCHTAELHRRSGSPLNRRDTAAALGYPNPPLFERRLDRLTSVFAALWCPQVDDGGARVPGAQAKLYLTDPVLAWLSTATRAGLPTPDLTVASESAIAVALGRAIDARNPGRWSAHDATGYMRTGSGGEIDFAPMPYTTDAGTRWSTPIESKWVSTGWRREALAVEARFGGGVLATKDLLDLDHPAWALPAPLVALLLG